MKQRASRYEYHKQRTEEKKEKGECLRCNNPVSENSVQFCEEHRILVKQESSIRFQENKEKIQQEARERKDDKRKNGICTDCSKPALANSDHCRICVLRTFSYNYLGKASKWKEIEEMINKVDSLCYHTGHYVSIEDGTLSIDHLKPVSTHPELRYDINNLVICEKSFNFAKSNRDAETFITYFYKVGKSFIKKQETIESAPDSYDI